MRKGERRGEDKEEGKRIKRRRGEDKEEDRGEEKRE